MPHSDLGSDTDTITTNDFLLSNDHLSPHCVCAVIAHLIASRFPQPNAFGAKVPVFSQLNIAVWRAYFTNYTDKNVVDFLEFGWPINYRVGQMPSSTCQNHQSALAYSDDVNHYLQTELSYGAIAGSFQFNPLHEDLVTLPLQTVPKRGSTTHHVVMDLSFPCSASVNDSISKTHYLDTAFMLRLLGIDQLWDFIIEKRPSCYVFKQDLKWAYQQFPIDPKDYKFLGFFWDKALYFDTRCPFGLWLYAMICQRTMRAVVYVFSQEWFSADVPTAFERLQNLFDQLGLQSSPEKACSPSTQIVCLGILVDTVRMVFEVPQDRLLELHEELLQWLTLADFSKRQLQALLGKLLLLRVSGRVGFLCHTY